ncbi:MAG: SPASM domain-containing protein [Candidatus Omnitrophota bacterium]|jgi:MoaA/NifB/PqqE/SkfB family radical SAM enzyme
MILSTGAEDGIKYGKANMAENKNREVMDNTKKIVYKFKAACQLLKYREFGEFLARLFKHIKPFKIFYSASEGRPRPLLKIDTCSFCNARCVWCWMHNSNKVKQGMMRFEAFKKIIDLNEDFLKEGNYLIEPYFNGEALLNPELFKMLDYLVQKRIGLTPRFDTNLSVKIDIEKFMSFPWKQIWVNVGGITREVHEKVMRNTDFELVINNLVKMLQINRNIVCIKMNPTKYNLHQLDKLTDFFVGLGGRSINALRYSTGLTLPKIASPEEIKFFFDNVVSEEMRRYLRFEYDLTGKDFGIKAKKGGCNFTVPSIFFDGAVTACCHDQVGLMDLGNATEAPLKVIFNSELYKGTLRKCQAQEFYFCKECN